MALYFCLYLRLLYFGIEALFVCVEPLCLDGESVFSGIVGPFSDKSAEIRGITMHGGHKSAQNLGHDNAWCA